MENTGSNRWQISLSLPVGTRVTYKYTRGSWESVEKGTSCEELDDRVLEVNGDITIADTVTMWRDLGGCD
jgi:pullulanase